MKAFILTAIALTLVGAGKLYYDRLAYAPTFRDDHTGSAKPKAPRSHNAMHRKHTRR